MKRLGSIWPTVVSFDNLLLAYRKARRGKAKKPDVARFALNLEKELFQLQRELQTDTYWPGAYTCSRSMNASRVSSPPRPSATGSFIMR